MNKNTVATIARKKRESIPTDEIKEVLKSIARKESVDEKDLATLEVSLSALWTGDVDFTYLDTDTEDGDFRVYGHIICSPPIVEDEDSHFDGHFVRGEFSLTVKG